ncbi:MAG: endonuclease/exonuclease/phosphatase family protein [Cryobacterium sp.]
MTDVPLIGPVTAPDLHVMTFNIRRRFRHLRPDSPDRWETRRPLVRRILAAEQPTLLGVQEALADQVEVVAAGLGAHYRWVGYGRNPAGEGERCPLFYDDRRLELTDWRQRALSTTPDTPGSRSWGNVVRRVVVSAEFTDRATGGKVVAFNTHFDHLSRRSRLESAGYLLTLCRAARVADPSAVVVVTGDFNTGVDSAAYRRLTADGTLRDAWTAAAAQLTPLWGTFANYRRRRPGGKRIDLILVGEGTEALSTGINAVRFVGKAASDHEPVQAVVRARNGGGQPG